MGTNSIEGTDGLKSGAKAMGLAVFQELNITATTKGDFGGSSAPFVNQTSVKKVS